MFSSVCDSCIWLWDNLWEISWNWVKKRRIKGKKNQSFTVKTHTHVPTNFALIGYYSKEALTNEYEYFTYRGKDCKDAFADFANFPKKIFLQKKSRQIIVRENYHKLEGECIKAIKITVESEKIVIIQENIEELHIQYTIYKICKKYTKYIQLYKNRFIPVMAHNAEVLIRQDLLTV